ncbi:uncharacterized protein LOC142796348 isoform X1 [Rhipicephalus microplus]|uniref:uncharacterized protein LOC142796348 isoform X1 n=1 Tax=Rhipicephalus microplus TaxID=6941 RepID=UPI003F6ADEF4
MLRRLHFYHCWLCTLGTKNRGSSRFSRQLFHINPPKGGTKREGGQQSRTSVSAKVMKLNHMLQANVLSEQLNCPNQVGQSIMPLSKIWSADHSIKKMITAETMDDVIQKARENGICNSSNAKVFLLDWTELEEAVFQEVLVQLSMDQRIFVVAEVAPPASSPVQDISERNDILLPEPTHDISISVSTEKLPKDLQCTLSAAASPLDLKHRRQLVRCIVEQMLVVCTRPRRELIRSVAEETVRAYPVALEDRSTNGTLLGRGYDSFFQQLEARVENIYRSKRGIQSSTPVSAQRSLKMSYGCMNWQTWSVLKSDELDEKQQLIDWEARKSPKDMDYSLAMVYMKDTYGAQRQFINSASPVHHAP